MTLGKSLPITGLCHLLGQGRLKMVSAWICIPPGVAVRFRKVPVGETQAWLGTLELCSQMAWLPCVWTPVPRKLDLRAETWFLRKSVLTS